MRDKGINDGGMDIESHEELVLFLNSLDDEINESMIAANRDPEKFWGGRDDIRRSAERIRETSSKRLCAVEKGERSACTWISGTIACTRRYCPLR